MLPAVYDAGEKQHGEQQWHRRRSQPDPTRWICWIFTPWVLMGYLLCHCSTCYSSDPQICQCSQQLKRVGLPHFLHRCSVMLRFIFGLLHVASSQASVHTHTFIFLKVLLRWNPHQMFVTIHSIHTWKLKCLTVRNDTGNMCWTHEHSEVQIVMNSEILAQLQRAGAVDSSGGYGHLGHHADPGPRNTGLTRDVAGRRADGN